MPSLLFWRPNLAGPALLPGVGRNRVKRKLHSAARLRAVGPHGSSNLQNVLPRRVHRPDVPWRSASDLRTSFLDFFQGRGHTRVTPVPIVPANRDDNTYFINSGMMQFKPVFLGTSDPDSFLGQLRRATNSQRCARIGGKHNDLDDVGRDGTHLTLFEMLGSWSFGDYSREEACGMAWEFLTNVLKLPISDLYVTYFGGDKELGLPADVRTRDIWLRIGVQADRILPFGKKDNFWEMAATGPCGPCTEIHFDHVGGGRCARDLVNGDHPEVMEVWNLVFMEFERHASGLRPLPRLHVDTGMGLERLSGIVQGVTSAFDTDLFQPILSRLHELSGLERPYGGLFDGCSNGVRQDTAYRIVADHLRLVGVCLADGLLPARNRLGLKLRNVLHRALRQAAEGLEMPPGRLAEVVPTLVQALEPLRPGMAEYESQIRHVLSAEEKEFIPRLQLFNIAFETMLSDRPAPASPGSLTEAELLALIRGGDHGPGLSYDLVRAFCADRDLSLPDVGLASGQAILDDEGRVTSRQPLFKDDAILLPMLQAMGIPKTETDSVHDYFKNRKGKYEFPVQDAQILAIVGPNGLLDRVEDGQECGIVLNSTAFYAEAGGQESDLGHVTANLSRHLPQRLFRVTHVRHLGGYVLHEGVALNGAALEAKRHVHLQLCADRRLGLMRHHTGTHLFNFVLRDLFGLGRVKQAHSKVKPDSFLFGFTCVSPIELEHVEMLEDHARQMIRAALPIHRFTIPLERAKANPHILFLEGKNYPSQVHLICMGDNYPALERLAAASGVARLPADSSPLVCAELCCGTHVQNSADLIDLVVITVRGGASYMKVAELMVGQPALEVRARGEDLRQEAKELVRLVQTGLERSSWGERLQMIDTVLGNETLPKVAREQVIRLVEEVRGVINMHENEKNRRNRREMVQSALEVAMARDEEGPVVVSCSFHNVGQTIKFVHEMKPSRPVLLTDSKRLLCYASETLAPLTALSFAQRLCDVVNASGEADDEPLCCHAGIGRLSKKYALLLGAPNVLSEPSLLRSLALKCQ